MTQSSRRQLPLLTLLQALAPGRAYVPWDTFEAAQIQRAIEAGLDPLLFPIMQGHPEAMASPLWPLLHGAHVTAQFLSSEQLEAIGELLDACEGRLPPLTLLKGISICRQHYPAPRLRIMRDIDILVDEAARPAVKSLLVRLGYRQRSGSQLPGVFFDTYHHSMPFFHAQRGVWVEVHRGLFHPSVHSVGIQCSAARSWPRNSAPRPGRAAPCCV